MPNNRNLITPNQLTSMVIVLFLGAFTVVGYRTVEAARTSAWAAELLAVSASLVLAFIFTALQNKFPGKSLIEYNELILGKYLGKLVNMFYLAYFINYLSLIAADLTFAYSILFYVRTPTWVFLLSLYSLCLLAALGGASAVGRLGELATPLLLTVVFLVSLGVLFSPTSNFSYLFPLLGKDWQTILHAAHDNFTVVFGNLTVFSMFIPLVKQQRQVKTALIKGILMGGLLILVVTIDNIISFGADRLENLSYTSAQMLRLIQVGGFLERIESVIVAAWLLVLFVEALITFYAAGLAAYQTFKIKNLNFYWLPILVLAFIINYFVIRTEFLETQVDNLITPYWIIPQLFIPILLLIIATLRKLKSSVSSKIERS